MNIFSPSRRYDLVLCDIDGCLCSESPGSIDSGGLSKIAEYNRLAVEEKDRPVVTVCTGRPQPFAEAICRVIGNDRVPAVAENGVWLYQPGDNSYYLDPCITEDDFEAIAGATDYIRKSFVPLGYDIQPGKTGSISIYHHDRKKLKDICPAIEQKCVEEGWPFRISMTWTYINCDLDHVSKGSGIKRLLEMVECDRSRIAGIGDTAGDIAIAENVGYFGCPGNAHREIRPHADYISPADEIDGVIDILGRLVGNPDG